MSWLARLANLVRSDRLSRDLDREMAFHLAERADDLRAAGLTREAAELEARRRFGNRGMQKERMRDADVVTWLESAVADLRYAVRALRASPAFTLVAVLSLALGIGANAAIFSLVDAVILRPLPPPVVRPGELLRLTMHDRGEEFTNPLWEVIRDRQDVFSSAFAYVAGTFNLAGGGEVRRVNGNWVSGEYFTTLGLQPAAGRLLTRADDVRGCPALVIVSDGFWQRELGSRADVVGRTLSMDGKPFTIVGVSPRGFTGIDVGTPADLFAPLCAEAVVRGPLSALDVRDHWFLHVLGRIRRDVPLAQLRARLAASSRPIFEATIPPDWAASDQRDYAQTRLGAEPASNGLSAVRLQYRRPLMVLLSVAGVVLLIACANVANLLLARASARRQEVSIRVALGAARGRLVRQFLTESVLLAFMGATLGVLFARWSSGVLVRLLSTRADTVTLDLSLDARLLAFSIAMAAATGLLFGLVPAWRASRVDPYAAMRGHGASTGRPGRSRGGFGSSFVAVQVALSLVLVVAAGLLLRTFRTLTTLDPGFRSDGVLLARVDPGRAVLTQDAEREFRRELLARLRAIPGVRAASASLITPVSGRGWNGRIAVDGFTPASPRDAIVYFNEVTDGYFTTLQMPLLAGRDLAPHDDARGERVAVINETMSRKFFGDASPVGRTYREDGGPPGAPRAVVRIVGVVRDSKYATLREKPRATAYVSMEQTRFSSTPVSYEIRTDGPPGALTPQVTAAATALHRRVSLEYTTLSAQVAESLARERLLATLAGFFGALALLLASVGLYGTMAYGVARRRNEIGIRIALGAARRRVVQMVLGDAGRAVALGIALGGVAAFAVTRLLASFLYAVTPTDPAVLALSALTLVAVALAASALPAWRAARVDPVSVLKE